MKRNIQVIYKLIVLFPNLLKAPVVSSEIGCWVEAFDFVPGAFKVDGTHHDKDVYIIRVSSNGAQYPGKHIKDTGSYATWDGKEQNVSKFEMLCHSQLKWVSCYGQEIPPNAFVGGTDEKGEIWYIGKCYHDGHVVVGMVKKDVGTLYYGWNGKEYKTVMYDILVV